MKNALISVYYKDGVAELAGFLAGAGWNIISTGGTAAFLRGAGVKIIDVSEKTGFPECLDGRVKTLHPAVHAAILARRSEAEHIKTLSELGIEAIDLVCVNLYPFFEKSRAGLSFDETVEFIDIGGPAMLRSAAKNWRDVIALCDSADYPEVIEALGRGGLDEAARRRLAAKVFGLTSAYDAAVSAYFLEKQDGGAGYTERFWTRPLELTGALRYGENAHQSAALYTDRSSGGLFSSMEILGGKELSYNNIRDLDAAWKCVCAFGLDADRTPPLGSEELRRVLPGFADDVRPACVAVKHNTPCGIALGGTAEEAFRRCRACDSQSIFGGIVAFNTKLSEAAAAALEALFLEIVIAPDFEEAALRILRGKKNLRIIRAPRAARSTTEVTGIDGGLLVQDSQRRLFETWQCVTKKPPEKHVLGDLIFGLRAVSFVKSNAVVIAQGGAAIGIGGGDTSRISAAKRAIERCAASPELNKDAPLALASDAFFPFPDIVEAAGEAGVRAIIQCGGSQNDGASIEACDRLGISMVFTGIRLFRH
ncbi:MAG: bifunctional phosphoribosylaminoimidazolecarboxamide formyltransferase/IMP cyclohydrolase [Spirochaetaceae bacterium]|jgi:phosphoribosylaminoimidazolecarboxamide formyltransferase/IMP cyclohydrolase|nr:bifunctional phosphoribosylaminoimidazolecarboxamide formyltransferase/IMP cyclohydrolase [Spirochaetaceae bacterium]